MSPNRIKIAEAADWPIEEIDETSIDCLDFTPDEAAAAALAWCWLLGADSESAAEEARSELFSDGGLFVALNLPAVEFLEWFRRGDWSYWPRSDGGEVWAWNVLDRARQVATGLGALAGEVSMAAAVARQPR